MGTLLLLLDRLICDRATALLELVAVLKMYDAIAVLISCRRCSSNTLFSFGVSISDGSRPLDLGELHLFGRIQSMSTNASVDTLWSISAVDTTAAKRGDEWLIMTIGLDWTESIIHQIHI